jgi:drug/metabolite transporter (DMT)-like permease
VAFLKEKVTKKQFSGLIVMLLGLIILTYSQVTPNILWSNPSLGDLLILFATVLWAIENVIAKRAMIDGESNFVVTFARMFIGAIFLFLSIPLLGKLDLLFSLTFEQITNILISTIILLGYVLFWYWSIKYINVSKATMILLLAPVITLIFGVTMLNEPLPTDQLAGSVLILIGAYFVTKAKSEFTTGV